MGDKNRQRTQDLIQAARRYTVAKQAEQAIEQHNLDKLVRTGLVVAEPGDKGYTSHRGYYGDCAVYAALNQGGQDDC